MKSQHIIEVEMRWKSVVDRSAFPFNLPAVRNLRSLPLHPAVTYLIGENGTGKSTLLEAIAVAYGFNAEGGSRNMRFSTRSTHTELFRYLRIAKGIAQTRDGFFLRAESFYNLATEIDKLDALPSFDPPIRDVYGGRSLHEQSHGEAFLATFSHRFKGKGLYILDEPEAALSPQRQLATLTRIHDLVKLGSQFIIATHSPILMAYPDSTIFSLTDEGIQKVSYFDTEHYKVMNAFIAAPKRMLRVLFEDA